MTALLVRSTTLTQSLPPCALHLCEASISKNTRSAYTAAYERASFALKMDAVQADDADLAQYFTQMHDSGLSPATIRLCVAAIRFAARISNRPVPFGVICDRVLAGIARQGAMRGRGQAKPLTWQDADAVIDACASDDSLHGARDAALLAVGSDALLRRSEIAILCVGDLNLNAGGAFLIVRRSKTDQLARGVTLYVSDRTAELVATWLRRAQITEGAVFRAIYRRSVGEHHLSARQVARIIAQRCAESGFADMSGHSLRVGSAVSLASAGASVVEMQQAGRWSSPAMPGRYAAGEIAQRGPVARYRYGRLETVDE